MTTAMNVIKRFLAIKISDRVLNIVLFIGFLVMIFAGAMAGGVMGTIIAMVKAGL